MSSSHTDDYVCMALLFCATFGVGSMSFGSIFAVAGPLLGSVAIYFLSACNLHASVAISKAFNASPLSIRSYGDLGFYAYGNKGRLVIIFSEASVCYLCPIAFFILGGTILLPTIFQDVTGANTTVNQWIFYMSITTLPIILIPTLKSAANVCVLGGLTAILSDIVCMVYSLTQLDYQPRETQIQWNQAIQVFGTIMFALGTAIVVPPLHRQHADPSRLPNIISVTLLMITSAYLIIGIVTYYQFGCTAPMTLLDEIPSDSIWKKIASGLMLIHVMLAFPVLLSPTLFELERYLLGKDADMEVLQQTIRLRSSKQLITQKPILSAQSIMQQENPFIYDTLRDESPTTTTAYYQEDSSAITIEDNVSYTMRDRFISIILRSVILGSQVFLALMLQSSFMDLLSLIGATAVTISCMIMPCLCYLRVCPIQLDFKGRADRALCRVIIVASGLLGLYCSINAIKNISHNLSTYQLFGPAIALDDSSLERYPYCHEGERD